MSGRPVFQSQFESRLWRRMNGGGTLGRFSAIKGATQAVMSDLDGHEGGVCSAVLVSLMDHLLEEDAATPETLMKIVSRSRSRDCMASVRASEIMLAKGDVQAAAELLTLSVGSMEVRNRSLAAARIYQAEGDMGNARESAMTALGSDPDCIEAYEILSKADPDAGWPQRRNIQDVLTGRRPEAPPGEGKVQGLYQIYYEWFRGNREHATDMLVGSPYYISKDPEYMLASARMSVDEKDWHSARMMYDNLLAEAPSFVLCEAAEANLAGDDPVRAVELFSKADQTSPRVMRGMVAAMAAMDDRRGMMEAMRSFLDSEWAGSDEWTEAVSTLLDMGMEREAAGLLGTYMDSMGSDAGALTMRSTLMMRSGEYLAALSAADEAVRKDGESVPARIQRARMLHLLGKDQKARSECEKVLVAAPDNREALELMRDIRSAEGGDAAVEACRRVLEADPGDAGSMIALADALQASGDSDSATDMYNKALRADGGAGTYASVISGMVRHGRLADALYMCREACKMHPGDPLIIRLRGNAEYGSGDYLKASASYAEALGADPGNPVLWHSRGMADESRGDMESAEASYRRAVDLDGSEPEYWVSLAAAQEARGDDASAVRSLNRALEIDPTMLYPLVRKSVILARAGRGAEAVGLLDLAFVSHPDNYLILREKIAVQMGMGDLKGAADTYARIPEGEADEFAIVNAAECYAALGRATEARSMVDRALDKNPDSVPLLKVRARLQLAAGDRRGAHVTTDRLLALTSGDPEVLRMAAEAGRAPGEEGPDEVYLEEPVPDAPEEPEPEPEKEDVDALYSLASSLAEADDPKGALKAVDRALAADPTDARCNALKASLVLASGDTDGASFLLASAMRESPDDPGLHYMMGRVRMAKGDARGALQELETAISLGKDDADVHAAKGEVLESLGAPERAAECYSAAVSRDPDRLDLSERLARLMFARREAMAADGMLNRILRKDPRRVSAILLKAEIAQSRNDETGLMAAYTYFSKCPNPGPDNTVRMVRILEETGHSAEARSLVSGKSLDEPTENSVKRNAEKAVRRAFSTKTSASDPDVIGYLGLDPEMASKVTAYLTEQRDYGHIAPGSEQFREMERKSNVAVMKLKWKDLEGSPRLPLEAVFVQCGYRDLDDAKALVAYVHKAMLTDVGRKGDQRLSEMAMGLPKGMSVYEIMRECDIGVYEARLVQAQII